MPKEYEKNELIKVSENKMLKELDKFVYSNIGTNKVYKLREILEKFEPIHMLVFAGSRGHRILVKLQTYDFPDGERRVGIEFIRMLE